MVWLHRPLFGATIAFVVQLYTNCETRTNQSAATTTMTTDRAAPAAADPYKSSRFIGHSLWVCPSGSALTAYSEIIAETAQELDSFAFLPHITLVAAMLTGEEDVLERSRQLASQLAPYEFELDTVSSRDAFFQCVYATMKRTPQVVAANQLARDFFPERQSDPPYVPHLSLVYGDLPQSTKEQVVIPKLSKELDRRSSETHTLPVDAFQVWSTQGDVKEWYLVETIPLTGSPSN